jgi:hypothetical protein
MMTLCQICRKFYLNLRYFGGYLSERGYFFVVMSFGILNNKIGHGGIYRK